VDMKNNGIPDYKTIINPEMRCPCPDRLQIQDVSWYSQKYCSIKYSQNPSINPEILLNSHKTSSQNIMMTKKYFFQRVLKLVAVINLPERNPAL
jgi:hypothetical protein